MEFELCDQQKELINSARRFVDRQIEPNADRFDREQSIPAETIRAVGQQGYLGCLLPNEWGGGGIDMISFGLLNEEIGRACSSVRSLLTVHCMVAQAVNRWGSSSQKELWLSSLAAGETLAALALTEPQVGSDAAHVEMTAISTDSGFLLNGRKKWISFGQIADLFLVLAQCDGKPTAFLVSRNSPGLSIIPIVDLLGLRASMLAGLQFEDCSIPREAMLGRIGFGFSHVIGSALDLGRYSVAWGCVGIGRACLEAALNYAGARRQFGAELKDHQLIQRLITRMSAGLKASRLLCLYAGYLRDKGDPRSIAETSIAKYHAAAMAATLAGDAVQIHGAGGCSREYAVERYFRDARIMEIIEGSTQILEVLIGRNEIGAAVSLH